MRGVRWAGTAWPIVSVILVVVMMVPVLPLCAIVKLGCQFAQAPPGVCSLRRRRGRQREPRGGQSSGEVVACGASGFVWAMLDVVAHEVAEAAVHVCEIAGEGVCGGEAPAGSFGGSVLRPAAAAVDELLAVQPVSLGLR